jgi:ubiquitin
MKRKGLTVVGLILALTVLVVTEAGATREADLAKVRKATAVTKLRLRTGGQDIALIVEDEVTTAERWLEYVRWKHNVIPTPENTETEISQSLSNEDRVWSGYTSEDLPPLSSGRIGSECIPSDLRRAIPNTCFRFQSDVSAARNWADRTTAKSLPPTSGGRIGNECIPSDLRRAIPNTCLRFQPDPSAAREWADHTTAKSLPPLSSGRIGNECIPSDLRRAIPNTCLRFQPDPLAAR